MPETDSPRAGRILGIGGVFFQSPDPGALRAWYASRLGFGGGPFEKFRWRPADSDGPSHSTVWSVFPTGSKHFAPSAAPFMFNYIVDDLDALLARLAADGVAIDPKRDDTPFGRFAWIADPDGNRIELWEPYPPAAPGSSTQTSGSDR